MTTPDQYCSNVRKLVMEDNNIANRQPRFLKRRDVRYWHKADMLSCTVHVCFWGKADMEYVE